MGTDSHCFIEYRDKNSDYWHSFGGRFSDRNYLIFGLMAGLRRRENQQLFPLKGIPEDLGYESENANQLYISDENLEGCISKEKAERWVKDGSSVYIKNDAGEDKWVTHPDWHSHTWFTTEEFEKIINQYFYIERKECVPEREKDRLDFIKKFPKATNYPGFNEPAGIIIPETYCAMLAAMKSLESNGKEARLVVWFDN